MSIYFGLSLITIIPLPNPQKSKFANTRKSMDIRNLMKYLLPLIAVFASDCRS